MQCHIKLMQCHIESFDLGLWLWQDVESEVLALQKAMEADIDVTIDCVGMTKSMKTALKATRSGGRVCLVGMGHNEMTLPLTPAAAR